MKTQSNNTYLQDIEFQIKMLNNLKGWLKNLMIFSSLCFVLVIFGPTIHPFIRPISLIIMIIFIIGCVIIGWGYRNGQNNVQKMINMIDKL